GLLEPLGGIRPGLGHKESRRRGEMPVGADVVERAGDLAVGLLAQLAAVLVLDAAGVPARFGEAGVVDAKDPPGPREGLGPHAPGSVMVCMPPMPRPLSTTINWVSRLRCSCGRRGRAGQSPAPRRVARCRAEPRTHVPIGR